MTESDLSAPVIALLKSQGYEVKTEVPFDHRHVDIVGVSRDVLCAVELKLRLNEEVLHQCYGCQNFTADVYAAIAHPPSPTMLAQAEIEGVGVLLVRGGSVETLLQPWCKATVWGRRVAQIRATCARMAEGGQSGLPNRNGTGITLDCWEQVKKYRHQNPGCRWPELFRELTHHYPTVEKMKMAMSVAGAKERMAARKARKRCQTI